MADQGYSWGCRRQDFPATHSPTPGRKLAQRFSFFRSLPSLYLLRPPILA